MQLPMYVKKPVAAVNVYSYAGIHTYIQICIKYICIHTFMCNDKCNIIHKLCMLRFRCFLLCVDAFGNRRVNGSSIKKTIVVQLLESLRCFGASANMNLSRYPSANRSPMSSFVQSRVGRFCSSSIRPCSKKR